MAKAAEVERLLAGGVGLSEIARKLSIGRNSVNRAIRERGIRRPSPAQAATCSQSVLSGSPAAGFTAAGHSRTSRAASIPTLIAARSTIRIESISVQGLPSGVQTRAVM